MKQVYGFLLAVTMLSLTAACNAPTSDGADDVAAAPKQLGSVAVLSDLELSKVCRATIAATMGRDPSIMTVTSNAGGIAAIRYKRPDDGTMWQSECRVEGDRAIWRTIDAFPGSGPGRWRTTGDDEVMTYTISGNAIAIATTYPDGSGGTKAYVIKD